LVGRFRVRAFISLLPLNHFKGIAQLRPNSMNLNLINVS
jgi:hypothetical protein